MVLGCVTIQSRAWRLSRGIRERKKDEGCEKSIYLILYVAAKKKKKKIKREPRLVL